MNGNIKQSDLVAKAEEAAANQAAKEPAVEAADINELVPAAQLNKTQAQLDSEMTIIRLETEKLRLEKEKLELEKLKKDVLDIRRKQEAERMSQETVQDALKFENERQVNHETLCTHMKGGQSETMLGNAPSQGNDSANYCVIDHTFSTGVRFRMCQRCGKTWFPRDADYREAMSWPTRNTASKAAVVAGLVTNWANAQMKSSLPHRQRPQQSFGEF